MRFSFPVLALEWLGFLPVGLWGAYRFSLSHSQVGSVF
jgi:hypothetical protein